jgi:hypothetical protein
MLTGPFLSLLWCWALSGASVRALAWSLDALPSSFAPRGVA